MHVGLVMECDYREGRTQEEAFAAAGRPGSAEFRNGEKT